VIEDTNHDLLAAVGRKRRDTKVDRAPINRSGETTVLRFSLLVESQECEDLYARNERAVRGERQNHACVQIAVDAVTHAHPLRLRLDVDVRSAAVDCVAQNSRNDFDRGRVLLDFFVASYLAMNGRIVQVQWRRVGLERTCRRRRAFLLAFQIRYRLLDLAAEIPVHFENFIEINFRNLKNLKWHSCRFCDEIQCIDAVDVIRVHHSDFQDTIHDR
jgi:hypothetical protein